MSAVTVLFKFLSLAGASVKRKISELKGALVKASYGNKHTEKYVTKTAQTASTFNYNIFYRYLIFHLSTCSPERLISGLSPPPVIFNESIAFWKTLELEVFSSSLNSEIHWGKNKIIREPV